MMKQLMDSFNELKVNQIEMQDTLREVQSRTEAVEAHAVEIKRCTTSTPADPVAAPPQPQPATVPSMGEQGAGLRDLRAPNLFRGDAAGILGVPVTAPGTGVLQSGPSCPTPLRSYVGNDQHDYREEQIRAPAPKIEFPKFDGENPKLWQQQCETYFEVFPV
jgi:hypothetical protein